MSILPTDIICYSCANAPTNDSSRAGDGISTSTRLVFTQLTSAAKLSFTSDGTDTRTVFVRGRDATGAVVSETVTLTSTVEALSVNTYERIQFVSLSGLDASRTVTCKQGAGGSVITTIPPNESNFRIMFENAFSTSSTQTRYDKLYFMNNNATLSLIGAKITLSSDPSGKLMAGLETSVNDTQWVNPRTLTPPDPTFVSVGTAQSVPSGNLNAGQAQCIGVWIKQSLGINDPAQKNSFTMQLTGTTV